MSVLIDAAIKPLVKNFFIKIEEKNPEKYKPRAYIYIRAFTVYKYFSVLCQLKINGRELLMIVVLINVLIKWKIQNASKEMDSLN